MLMLQIQIQELMQMRFNELAQDAKDDEYNKWDMDDTRRPKITLRHLNKMRNRRELARSEHATKVEKVQLQYGQSSDSAE